MKVVKTLLAQAIRFGEIKPSRGQSLYGPNLVRAFEDKYGFLETPKTVADFDLSKGIVFYHGYFENRLVIDKVQIYNNGIVVETKETTDDCVAVIADITAWAAEKANIIFTENTTAPQLYLSHCEVETEINFPMFQIIGSQINEFMTSYNEQNREYKFASFTLQLDPASGGPTPFKFERRANQPFSSNLYYSSAPLKTQDHIRILTVIEAAFIKTTFSWPPA
jgi:hypothetical protein